MRTVSFESYFDPDRHTGSLLKPGNGGDDAPDTVPPHPVPTPTPPPEEVDLDEEFEDDDDLDDTEDGDDEFED